MSTSLHHFLFPSFFTLMWITFWSFLSVLILEESWLSDLISSWCLVSSTCVRGSHLRFLLKVTQEGWNFPVGHLQAQSTDKSPDACFSDLSLFVPLTSWCTDKLIILYVSFLVSLNYGGLSLARKNNVLFKKGKKNPKHKRVLGTASKLPGLRKRPFLEAREYHIHQPGTSQRIM